MPTQKKMDAVASLEEKIAKSKAFFLTDYQGLTHQQLEKLRRALKKVQADYQIVKNNLFKIALQNKEKDKAGEFEKALENPTAVLYAHDDPLAAVKALAAVIKELQLPKIKMGIFEGAVSDEAYFTKLATLPAREVLLAQLVGRLQSPLYGLHYALSWNMRSLVTVLTNVKGKK